MIREVGPTRRVENLAEARDALEISASGRVVMPGFVDCHTHLIFPPPGHPSEEGAERAVRGTTGKFLQNRVRGYLEAMARHGTTTVDVKTSGAADGNLELKLLRVLGVFRSAPLSLIPSVFCNPADESSLDRLVSDTLPKMRRRRLGQFVDIGLCGEAFSGRARRVLDAATGMGFTCRIHADHPGPGDAVEAAIAAGVQGIDHLEYADERMAEALGKSQVMVTLLPGPAFRAERRTAPARALIDAGATVALGSNFNPQHTPALSMQTVVALAAMQMGMSVAEAIAASTINSAWALGCANKSGSLEPGKPADILILNVSDYQELANHFGMNLAYLTLKRGEAVYEEGEIMPRAGQARQPSWG